MQQKMFDFRLEALRFNGKDLAAIISILWAVFTFIDRIDGIEASVLEARIQATNAELRSMDGNDRNEAEEREYISKLALIERLRERLESIQ